MRQLNWVTVKRYCELSGETEKAVEGKRSTGHWIKGVHWVLSPDNRVRINLEKVEEWVVNGNQATQKVLKT